MYSLLFTPFYGTVIVTARLARRIRRILHGWRTDTYAIRTYGYVRIRTYTCAVAGQPATAQRVAVSIPARENSVRSTDCSGYVYVNLYVCKVFFKKKKTQFEHHFCKNSPKDNFHITLYYKSHKTKLV